MGVRRSHGSLAQLVQAGSQRQAYNNFRRVKILFEKIVERTPVLSGELRAGWHVGYGTPDFSYREVTQKSKGMPAVMSKPAFNLTYDRDKAWTIYIANGVPYAQRVENGWSSQAPVGMVRISILEVFGFGVR